MAEQSHKTPGAQAPEIPRDIANDDIAEKTKQTLLFPPGTKTNTGNPNNILDTSPGKNIFYEKQPIKLAETTDL